MHLCQNIPNLQTSYQLQICRREFLFCIAYYAHISCLQTFFRLSKPNVHLHTQLTNINTVSPKKERVLLIFSYINTNQWLANSDCDWMVEPWYAVCMVYILVKLRAQFAWFHSLSEIELLIFVWFYFLSSCVVSLSIIGDEITRSDIGNSVMLFK